MAKAEQRLELRKRRKYLVRQGREFPVPAIYVGKHLCEEANKMLHLFVFVGDEDGIYFDDKLKGVEEFSKKRYDEISAAAERYLGRVK